MKPSMQKEPERDVPPPTGGKGMPFGMMKGGKKGGRGGIPAEEVNGTPPVCGDWRKSGICSRGSGCRYVHVEPAGRGRGRGTPAGGKGSHLKEVPCKFHMMGRCTKDDCPFGHFDAPGYPYPYPPYPPYPPPPGYGYGYPPPPPPPGIPPHPDMMAWYGYHEDDMEEEVEEEHKEWSTGAPALTKEEEASGMAAVENVRRRVATFVYQNEGGRSYLLVPTLIGMLSNLEQDELDLMLGLGTNRVGLTRFRSLLIKRSIRHCHEAKLSNALEHLRRTEEASVDWLPPLSCDTDFAVAIENELGNRFVELLKIMAASPFSRFRLHGPEAAKTDPSALSLSFWSPHAAAMAAQDAKKEKWEGLDNTESNPADPLPAINDEVVNPTFVLDCGVPWSPACHGRWPAPFRGRAYLLLLCTNRKGYNFPLDVTGRILSYLPPVCESDIHPSDRAPGHHDFLDVVTAILAHYTLNAIGPATPEDCAEAKERLGSAVWPFVLEIFGSKFSPKMAGMLLQMEADDILFDLINTRRFTDSLQEAWRVLRSA
eukprot:Sspe_Gene.12165::Locus_4140_Transcript_1_1_Confidence_1.000_Length_2026::g.12165::m.12165